MRDISHNSLCNRLFSQLAKIIDCKDLFSLLLIIPIIFVNMITESFYPINPPNLQGEKRVLMNQSGI